MQLEVRFQFGSNKSRVGGITTSVFANIFVESFRSIRSLSVDLDDMTVFKRAAERTATASM